MQEAYARSGEQLLILAVEAGYDTLTRPWRTVIGPIHPDDPAVTA